jgi:hypothetical protein
MDSSLLTCDYLWAGSSDELAKVTVLKWIKAFVFRGKQDKQQLIALLPCMELIISGVLPALSSESVAVRELATSINAELQRLIKSNEVSIDFIGTLSTQLSGQGNATRLAALRWLVILHRYFPKQMESHMNTLFSLLLQLLSDKYEPVEKKSLKVMTKLAADEQSFLTLVTALVTLLHEDTTLTVSRGCSALRQLSSHISPAKVRTLYLWLSSTLSFEN